MQKLKKGNLLKIDIICLSDRSGVEGNNNNVIHWSVYACKKHICYCNTCIEFFCALGNETRLIINISRVHHIFYGEMNAAVKNK